MRRPSGVIGGMILAVCLTVGGMAIVPDPARAQPADLRQTDMGGAGSRMPIPRTDGPRDLIASFLELRDVLEDALLAYLERPSRAEIVRINLALANLRTLVDLDAVPVATRRQIGDATVLALLDVIDRIPPPAADAIPGYADFDDADSAAWRLPDTPLRIVRVEQGARDGEWLFAQRTVEAAPRYVAGIMDIPLDTALPFRSWSADLPQISGPMVPASLAAALPEPLRALWLGVPVWKAIVLSGFAALGLSSLVLVRRWAVAAGSGGGRGEALSGLVAPVFGLLLLLVGLPAAFRQLMPFGQLPGALGAVLAFLVHLTLAWLFWKSVNALVAMALGRQDAARTRLDGHLPRLIGLVVGVIGVIVLAMVSGQRLGIPVVSLVAGLGVGGLAVALAVRPTLENLIGGLILYIDRPVRVGDFCTFEDKSGTVERIGIRSTEVRGLDRTVITIPNARFADMELINWAECDMMLIAATLGLRLETTPDQMRYALAEIRKMIHGHPRIDSETVRVRYNGPRSSAREFEVRIYALTREWNDFFAIREDIFLRIDEIVARAGAEFAVPAQSLRVRRDEGGVHPDLQQTAETNVAAWRRAGILPFPKFSQHQIDEIADTIAYPPEGSPDLGGIDRPPNARPETLSTPKDAEPPAAQPPTDDPAAKR